jgi:TIR domain
MDPETGGIYEHKLANMLGYPLTQASQPPAEFIAAAKILEEQGYVRRLRRNPNIETMGIWPTPKGLEEVECLSSKLTLLRVLGAPIPTAPVDQSVTRYDFFIAYATPDRRQAQRLCWCLQDHSCKVFLDVEDLSPGASWPPELQEAMEASRAIVVLVSSHTAQARYQQEEIVQALQLADNKPRAHTVIPVILEELPQGAKSMPYGLSSLQAKDATRPGGLERVAADLAAWLEDL